MLELAACKSDKARPRTVTGMPRSTPEPHTTSPAAASPRTATLAAPCATHTQSASGRVVQTIGRGSCAARRHGAIRLTPWPLVPHADMGSLVAVEGSSRVVLQRLHAVRAILLARDPPVIALPCFAIALLVHLGLHGAAHRCGGSFSLARRLVRGQHSDARPAGASSAWPDEPERSAGRGCTLAGAASKASGRHLNER
jgi:hypothetical protein